MPEAKAALQIVIVTPAERGSRSGNRKTALRQAGLLRKLGARVRIREKWQGEACDLLLAVHAVKSADSVLDCAARRPQTRIVVLCAGTDVYPVFRPDAKTGAALERADALITLQPEALEVLPADLRQKARCILQSATAQQGLARFATFTACVLAHLRPVKDPLLPFAALAHIPTDCELRIRVAGRALLPELADAARAAGERDPRAQWLGELSRQQAARLLAQSQLCIVPSAAEGGANVVSEAIAAKTPILATAVPGNTGLLGADWPGLFAPGDAAGLAALLRRCKRQSITFREFVSVARELIAQRPEQSALYLATLVALDMHGDDIVPPEPTPPSRN